MNSTDKIDELYTIINKHIANKTITEKKNFLFKLLTRVSFLYNENFNNETTKEDEEDDSEDDMESIKKRLLKK